MRYNVNIDNCGIVVVTCSFCLHLSCAQDTVPSELDDDDIIFEHSGSQSDRKTSGSMASSDVLTVNQLIESVCTLSTDRPHLCLLASDCVPSCFLCGAVCLQVHETARQVANVPVSANPVPYDQMKSQCEALVMEKQQKMSVLLSFKHSRTDSHGSTGVDGLETNEVCMSCLRNLSMMFHLDSISFTS